MYIKSTHAREVGLETFMRALFYAITAPDLKVKKRLKDKLGNHVVCLNTESALTLLFKVIPGREPGMIVAIDSTLAKQSKKVAERSGFKTVVFQGEQELVEVLEKNKVSIIYMSDHFNQAGRKTHRALESYKGLVCIMQYRQIFRPLAQSRYDVLIWRPRGFTRSSGGVVLVSKDAESPLIKSIKGKMSTQEKVSSFEVLRDIAYGLFGRVQRARYVSMRPSRIVLQLLEYRMRNIVR